MKKIIFAVATIMIVSACTPKTTEKLKGMFPFLSELNSLEDLTPIEETQQDDYTPTFEEVNEPQKSEMDSITTQNQLSFKGVPIEGNVTDFCTKLKSKGFTQLRKENNKTVLSGNFTNRQVIIYVIAGHEDRVINVTVFSNQAKKWNTLLNFYNHYKDLYTLKYGNPTFVKEENKASSDDNFSLMHEVEEVRAVYNSKWEITGGRIDLNIIKTNNFLEGVVTITYRNSENSECQKQNDLNEI